MQERTAVEVATLKVARVLQSNHLCPMVPTTKISQIEFVNEGSRLNEVIDLLRHAPRVAVDIESNGFFRYHERVCLVQLASAETAFLVDPLAINDVRPLGELLADRSVEKVFHAADNDLRSLDRDWGFRVNNLFDTSIAAAFVGSERLGLQSVMKEYTGVELAKPRRLQLSDWTKRPLSPEAQKYAADDVLHLLQVREALSERLNELSRLPWTKAEFERMQKVAAYSYRPRMGLPFDQRSPRFRPERFGCSALRVPISRTRSQPPRPPAVQGDTGFRATQAVVRTRD